MKVEVKLFAVARQLAGCERVGVELPAGATVRDLRAALLKESPALASIAPMLLFAVDREYAGDESVLSEDADVACIPPVSGG
jgi:molybdopterin converting factor subunit 1